MARGKGFEGIGRVRAKLKRLPDAFRVQMVAALDRTGRLVAKAMGAKAPRRTGALARGIDFKVSNAALRLRVGLIGKRATSKSTVRKYLKAGRNPAEARNFGNLFYGRIQDLGRRKQVALRKYRDVPKSGKRRFRGKLVPAGRTGPDYPVEVPAMSPKRFISGRGPELQAALSSQVKGIWARALRADPGLADD